MPAKSKSQQRLFGMVDAYQKGELDNASKEVKDIAKSISHKDARKFAKTKHKGLPNRVKKGKKKVNESTLRLSEGELCFLIKESVNRLLKEYGEDLDKGYAIDRDGELAKSIYTTMRLLDEKIVEYESIDDKYADETLSDPNFAGLYLVCKKAYQALRDVLDFRNEDY